MSNIRVYNLKSKKNLTNQPLNKEMVKQIIENNSLELLRIKVLETNFSISDDPRETIETLGFDEDYRLVVIEYHCDRFGSIFNKGLIYLDYLTKNIGKVKSILYEKYSRDILDNLVFKPRLIVIGNDFNKYDEYAIKQLPYDIELIKFQMTNNDYFILEKCYHHFVPGKVNFSLNNLSKFEVINEFVLSLGDEVGISYLNGFVSYRKICNFMYILEQESLTIVLKQKTGYKKYLVQTQEDVEKILNLIEKVYDEN